MPDREPLTTREYDGLRIYQRLLYPYTPTQRVEIDLDKMRREHPEWQRSLEAAFDWISRVLFAAHQQGLVIPPTRTITGSKLRISEETIEEIRSLRRQGFTYAEIQKHTGISRPTIIRKTIDLRTGRRGRRAKSARSRA